MRWELPLCEFLSQPGGGDREISSGAEWDFRPAAEDQPSGIGSGEWFLDCLGGESVTSAAVRWEEVLAISSRRRSAWFREDLAD